MRKNTIYILIFLFYSTVFAQKFKTITEFKKEKDSMIKTRITEFNKSGQMTQEVKFGGYDAISKTFRNKNRVIEYDNGRRESEYNCEDFVAKDTCVIRSFSIYEFDPDTKVEKQTLYESDSLIRLIREVKLEKKMKISKTHSWEFFPVREPDFEKALILIDTTYFDKRNRLIKRVRYNSRFKEPIIEKYVYSKDKYTRQTIGTRRDTIMTFDYIKLQKKVDKQNIEYRFVMDQNYKYEIEYY